ncbi:type II secretion system protein N [Klebsiella sp. NPDC088457]
MPGKTAIGLLLSGAYLFWLLVAAPARLLTLALPEGVGVGELTGTVWQGEARQLTWRGVSLDRLRWKMAFSSGLPGWQITLSDPGGVRGQVWLHGLTTLRLHDGHLVIPAALASRWFTPDIPVEAGGQISLTLPAGRFNRAGCQQLTQGRAQWQEARLNSPAGTLELASVSGQLSCTPAGALALTLRQDSQQLSLSGQGTLNPDGRYAFRGSLQMRQGTPPLLAMLLAQNPRKDEQGRIPWQLQGQW